jgi:diguanylate cyclase
MRSHGVAPTPRNYDLWFAFCGSEHPALAQRINLIVRAGGAITPSVLDDLHREFFTASTEVTTARDCSLELQKIAGEMVQRIGIDRAQFAAFGQILSAIPDSLSNATTAESLRQASIRAGDTTNRARKRLQALEQLLAASVLGIADLRAKLAKAEEDANRDTLTGVANRRKFDATIVVAIERAANQKTQLALLLLDVDHFKRFNDTYGHLIGDKVLTLVAHVLMQQVREQDTVARYGGEEFAIILPGADLPNATSIAEQIRQEFERRPIVNVTSGTQLGSLTCSIGVTSYRHGERVGDLIDRADQALYQAKSSGRNVVRFVPA